jgi:hypothetical protein
MKLMDLSTSNYQQWLSDLYFELGLFDRVTLLGDIPFVSAREQNAGGNIEYSANSLGDSWFGARIGVLRDPLAVAFETRLMVPTGNPRAVVPTGTGDFRGELRLIASKALQVLPIYFDWEFGFTLRGGANVNSAALQDTMDPKTLLPISDPQCANDPNCKVGVTVVNYSPEIVMHGEVGAALVRWQGANRVMLIAMVDYRGSTTHSKTGDFSFTLVPNDSELTTIGANLMWFVYHGIGISARFVQSVEGRRLPHFTTVGGTLFVAY